MNKKWWFVILSLILFGVESIFANFFPEHLFSDDWIFIPRFLFIFFIFFAVYYDEKKAILYSFIFGIVMDIVFIEILGIYLVWYPLIVFLVSKLMKILHNHLIIMIFITLIAITLLEFILYAMNYLLQITHFTLEYFLNNRLYPTILLNSVFYILFSYLLKRFFTKFKKVKDEEEGMFQS